MKTRKRWSGVRMAPPTSFSFVMCTATLPAVLLSFRAISAGAEPSPGLDANVAELDSRGVLKRYAPPGQAAGRCLDHRLSIQGDGEPVPLSVDLQRVPPPDRTGSAAGLLDTVDATG